MFIAFKEDLHFCVRHPRVRYAIIGFALSILVVLIIGAAYWWPVQHKVDQLKAEIEDRRKEIASAEYKVKLGQTSSYAARQMALIDKKLDASIAQAEIVQNITMLARRNNVKIISETYEEGKEVGGYSPLFHEITVQGGYSALRGFIYGIQQLPTLTVVQDAVIGRSSSTPAIKAQINIITYRRTPEK